jgi:flagellin-like protein
MKNKKGISGIVVTVLLVLIAIAAVVIIWAVISSFIKNSTSDQNLLGAVSKTKFTISPLTSKDIAFDRFKITNTGEENMNSYVVRIDGGPQKKLVIQKFIRPREEKYLYLEDYYSDGKHTLSVVSNGYSQNIQFDVPADLHVIISNVTVA